MNTLLKSPEIADTLHKQGLQPTGGTPEQLAETAREATSSDGPRSCARRRFSPIRLL